MTKPLNSLLQKEMSRKEFLATMGFGLVSVMGLSSAIQMITGKPVLPSVLNNNRTQSGGYGSSSYGGKRSNA